MEKNEEMNEIYLMACNGVKHGRLEQIILRMWDTVIEGDRKKFEQLKKEAIKKIASINNSLFAIEDAVRNLTLEEK